MSSDIVLHYLTALGYLGLGTVIWSALYKHVEINKYKPWYSISLLFLIIIHGVAIHMTMLHENHITINWSLGLSFTIWIGLMIYWLESNFIKAYGFLLALLPIASLVSFLAAIFPPDSDTGVMVIKNNTFLIHLIISLISYSIIAVGALQALIMTGLDRHLHRPQDFSKTPSIWGRALDAQPPLMVQERILFRLIGIGFVLMTLAIITGSVVSMNATGAILPRDHKTFFTLISWLIFGVLLFGRIMWGWRGRVSLRWTLVGFGLLMLAYTGTRFIFEVLLHKG